MNLNISDLEHFLYSANTHGYAGGGNEVAPPQRPGFDEIEYKEGDWLFHDSYAGHYFAPGQEIVYYKGEPIWAMAYAGGMEFEYHGQSEITHECIVFLKKALLQMDPKNPFRGPELYVEPVTRLSSPVTADGNAWRYVSSVSGDTRDFIGNEKIYRGDALLFEQNFIGGIIV